LNSLFTLTEERRMNSFVQRHRDSVIGTLNGFDRLRFRGTLRWLCYGAGMGRYLSAIGVRLNRFKEFTTSITARIRASMESVARAAGRPMEYLSKPSLSKEEHARTIAERDGIREGLIGLLSTVEPCRSFMVRRDPVTRLIDIHGALRKCLHYYSYWMHPTWGFCHVRVQTWFPMTVHICLNGREWLARQMDRAGLAYRRRANAFVWIEDVARAQALLDSQLQTCWADALNEMLGRAHPHHAEIVSPRYYWSADESEWASDVLFRSPMALRELYPRLIDHGMRHFGSREVMRFLGRWVPSRGGVNKQFEGEVTTDLRERPEGMRIKHRINRNSIKMYDKQGSVLRVETTINSPHEIRVFRRKEGQKSGSKTWRMLRKGVADMYRRAEVGQAANERYLDSLAAVEDKTPLGVLTATMCRPARWKGGRVRAINPLSPEDTRLLEAVNRGEFAIQGFRNRDLRERLYGQSSDRATQRKQAAAVTRKLRLMRAHGLIHKVPRTHRYKLSPKGRVTIAAVLAAKAADVKALTRAA
jgi:hypothetical protein